MLGLAAASLSAVPVHVPEGTMVSLALRSDVTPETVEKGDRVEFAVVENVVVGRYVVIPQGATAWATVAKVKGAGKKDAKDASVILHIIGVYAADKQVIPLRLIPNKNKKTDPADNDIEETAPLSGPGPTQVGAPKGKLYAAYTDSGADVNAPASAPPPASTSAATGSGALSPQVPAAPPAPEPARVDFRSDPMGGEVVIDGSSVGITPTNQSVSPGLHDIEVQVSGYQRWKRRMRVEPGSLPTVVAHMVKE